VRRIAVVGAGYWGKNLVRIFQSLGALEMICESDSDRLKELQEKYPGVKGALSFSDALNDQSVSGIAIATPASTHSVLVREALLAGKDVYVEKPLCLSETEGQALNQLARERGRILMVGHLLWYHPVVLKLKELIDVGELGRIQYVYSNRLNLGKLRREENVLWSFAPHDVSVILGLLGEEPDVVQAQGGNYLHQQIADTTVSVLSFPSGVRAHIFVSWLHPFKEQKLVVVGDRKMAVFEDTLPWQEKLKLYPHTVSWSHNLPIAQKAEAEIIDIAQAEPLKAECEHFLECMESREVPRTDGEEGLRVLRILNSCQAALEQSTAINVSNATDLKATRYFVHGTAVIDSDVNVGEGTKIWHFSHILGGCRIGVRCNIGQNVVLGPNVRIGNGCKIQNNVSVYEGVTLEDDVFCGPSMVFTNVMNPRAHIVRKHEYRQTLVKKGSTIGANATIVCGVTLGRFSFIGAGAVVAADVPDYALMVGVPARRIGWMCECGERLGEDLQCPACVSRYRFVDSRLEIVA
jgi:UDP-2-acetamido-3-amino-2,3-dideoxy-glucuronate N-acetyltransferase